MNALPASTISKLRPQTLPKESGLLFTPIGAGISLMMDPATEMAAALVENEANQANQPNDIKEEKEAKETKLSERPVEMTPLVELFQAKDIRIIGTVEDPLFYVNDVAKHIEDENVARILHEEQPKTYVQWDVLHNAKGEARKSLFFTEMGLYRYLLNSQKALARPFQIFTYNLLCKERKQIIDETDLAIRIEQGRFVECKRIATGIELIVRDEKINQNSVLRKANIARDDLRRVNKEIKELEREAERAEAIKSKAAGRMQDDDSSDTEDDMRLDPYDAYEAELDETAHYIEMQKVRRNLSRSLNEISKEAIDEKKQIAERVLDNPLVAIFKARNIRICGSVCEPLFAASDIAEYMGDDNADRYFRDQTPDEYIRWEKAADIRGQLQKTRFVTEPGLYRYLLQSTLKKAEGFQTYTYGILKKERCRTVNALELALKIERTKAEDMKKRRETAESRRRAARMETGDFVKAANDFREELEVAKKKLEKLKEKKFSKLIAEQKQKSWAPFEAPN